MTNDERRSMLARVRELEKHHRKGPARKIHGLVYLCLTEDELRDAADIAIAFADEVERLMAEVERLTGLAYLCPPNPPEHDGQLWWDWVSQMKKKLEAARV